MQSDRSVIRYWSICCWKESDSHSKKCFWTQSKLNALKKRVLCINTNSEDFCISNILNRALQYEKWEVLQQTDLQNLQATRSSNWWKPYFDPFQSLGLFFHPLKLGSWMIILKNKNLTQWLCQGLFCCV